VLRSSARPLEVINVDNGSRDQTPQVLASWTEQASAAGIETKHHRFNENVGAIVGRNTAIEMARGDYIVFLDNDTLVAQADWLEKLQRFLEENPNCAAVAPKMLFPWQPFDIECCGCGVSKRGRIQYVARGDERYSVTEPFKVQCAISACWMMPRCWLEKIGVLDEAYSPVQYEDLDWCYRAREADGEIWALPSVEVFHFEHTTTGKSDDINFAYVTTKNGLTFKKRWSKMFGTENGPSEDEAMWQTLDKRNIEDVDWHALLP
jgi:GT2 family glycosyltransferase